MRTRPLSPRAAEKHQDRLLSRADSVADAAERIVQRVWRRLLDVIEGGGSHPNVFAAARRILAELPNAATEVLDALKKTASDTSIWAHRRLDRAELLESDVSDLVLPPLSQQQIDSIVYSSGWVERLAELTKLAQPQVLAAQIANGVQSGISPAQIAREIRPLVQGVQTSARRVARTAGLWVAHEAELHTYEQMPDMIVGYQIHAVLDRATRPLHRERDGNHYYREPKGDQLGFDDMPRPPRESAKMGHVWAYNCRCWLEPIVEVD